ALVADGCIDDAGDLTERQLDSPETSRSERCLLGRHVGSSACAYEPREGTRYTAVRAGSGPPRPVRSGRRAAGPDRRGEAVESARARPRRGPDGSPGGPRAPSYFRANSLVPGPVGAASPGARARDPR